MRAGNRSEQASSPAQDDVVSRADAGRSWPRIALDLLAIILTMSLSGIITVFLLWGRGFVEIGKEILRIARVAWKLLVSTVAAPICTLRVIAVYVRRLVAGESIDSISEDLAARFGGTVDMVRPGLSWKVPDGRDGGDR